MLCAGKLCEKVVTASRVCIRRNLGVTSVVLQQQQSAGATTDPIQKLYLDKIREFRKSSASDTMYGADAKTKKAFDDEMAAIKRKYGSDKEDFSKFPKLGPYKDADWKSDQI